MKRILSITTALVMTLGTTFAAPTNGNDHDNITASFRKEFQQAQIISTEAGSNYTKLTFKMNGAVMFAFYSTSGELLAITHNITSDQLPLQLLLQLKHNYNDYWISDLFECDTNGSSTYYITLETADQKLTLRSSDNQWETYSRSSKI